MIANPELSNVSLYYTVAQCGAIHNYHTDTNTNVIITIFSKHIIAISQSLIKYHMTVIYERKTKMSDFAVPNVMTPAIKSTML